MGPPRVLKKWTLQEARVRKKGGKTRNRAIFRVPKKGYCDQTQKADQGNTKCGAG